VFFLSTDGPSGRPSRCISDTASIGDTTTTLTVDPGSEITVIDQELLSTLSENVARPAQSVTPVQFAAWNGTPDGELHNAYHVAIRPRWCDEPRWVLMYAARLSEIMPDKIIWGRDAAEQCGLVITMSRSAPVVCSAPPADAPVPPVLAAPDDTLPRVAVMAPDPSTPGLDGQCCADEVESPAEQQMFTAQSALDVALAKVDQCVALADHPALQDKIKTAMRAVYWRSKHAPKPDKLEPPISGVMLRTRLIPGAYPNSRAKERRRTAAQIAAIDAQTEEWLAHGVFEAVNDDSVSTTSAVLVVDKFDEQHVKSGERVCGDYRDVNRIVMRDCGKTVVVEDGLEKVSVGQYRSKFDGASYYTQLLIDETSRTIYTLQINRSLIVRPTRAQFGMRNAGAVAQRASDEIFGSFNVVLNADKIVILREWIVLMGHEVGPDMVRALPGRLQLLLEWPAPTSIKQTVSFLAAASHYRAFIPAFAQWAGELRAAAIHGKKFEWTAAAQAAFANLRAAFAAAATLQRIRSGEPLYVTTDASAEGVSFAIGQRDELGVLRMVYAGGRSTESYERRYSPMDLEGVAVLTAVNRAPNLLGAGAPVTVLTDSRPLVDFFTKAPQILDPHRAPVRSRIAAALQGFDWAWEHVAGEHNEIMDAASRAAWTPTSGITPSGPTTVAHTLLPPAAADDDDSADSDDQTEADETALRAPPTAGAAPPTDQLESSPWQTPTRVNDYDESSAAHVDAAISTDGATDASTELISHADGGEALVDDASTLSEGAVPEGPANLPTAFNVPIELGSDVELDEVYAQERRAWAEAQRNDPALRTLFSHAHGIHQKNKSIQKREPSIDSDGRLFVAFGHDHARRLVVPSERAPALIGATHQQLDHRSADATCAELQKAFWWPGMLKQVDDWCARCPICQSAEILEVYEREWVRVFGPPESLHPDDALEFNAKALRSMCGRHGTRLINVAPYNKQANGLVERFIQTIKRALLARMHGRNAASWDKELSEAVWSYMSGLACTSRSTSGARVARSARRACVLNARRPSWRRFRAPPDSPRFTST
jgi:transposase InsO family protein